MNFASNKILFHFLGIPTCNMNLHTLISYQFSKSEFEILVNSARKHIITIRNIMYLYIYILYIK